MARTQERTGSERIVYIVDGCRTPFLKAKMERGAFTAADLAVKACQSLLLRMPFKPKDLDEVVTGCAIPSPEEANISRVISLRLGCGFKVPAYTVMRNCASGMQALDSAMKDIETGECDLVLAGGTDAMSHAPLFFPDKMANWLGKWLSARALPEKIKALLHFHLSYLKPTSSLMLGLKDPLVGLSMGQTAEILAYEFGISREALDAYALESHVRALNAIEQGYFSEIMPIFDSSGHAYLKDDGVRADTSLDKLAKLKPYFDKFYGQVTAGNSSQVTDGAAFLILASEKAVKHYNLPVLAKIVDVEWAGLDPAKMGLGPVYAATPILKRHGLTLKDIDYWEINEAFAAQVLACIKAWDSDTFCQEALGLSEKMGCIDQRRLNIDGGAIAMGHPIGASGARIVLHLAEILKRQQAKRGIAAICIGGGQGGAMLIERVQAGDSHE